MSDMDYYAKKKLSSAYYAILRYEGYCSWETQKILDQIGDYINREFIQNYNRRGRDLRRLNPYDD